MGIFNWTEKSAAVLDRGGVIAPDERLPWPQTTVMGVQHVIAMFGATVLAPLLMGFNPNVAILMSGIGTLIFFFITGGKVPSYLGSSFAFIGVVIAASGYAGPGPNANLGVALGASSSAVWSTPSSASSCMPPTSSTPNRRRWPAWKSTRWTKGRPCTGSSASCRRWSPAPWWP